MIGVEIVFLDWYAFSIISYKETVVSFGSILVDDEN